MKKLFLTFKTSAIAILITYTLSCNKIDYSKSYGYYKGIIALDSSKVNFNRLSPAEKMSYTMFSVMLQNFYVDFDLQKDSIFLHYQMFSNPSNIKLNYHIEDKSILFDTLNVLEENIFNKLRIKNDDTILGTVTENDFTPLKIIFVKQLNK